MEGRKNEGIKRETIAKEKKRLKRGSSQKVRVQS